VFEPIDAITRQVEAVYELFGQCIRGDVVPHYQIRAILGVEPHEGRWDHVVNRVRARVQDERGIATWPETTVGYRLLTANEQVEDLPRWRLKKAARQACKARRSVEALPDANLSDHQRRVKRAQIEALRKATSEVRKQMRIQEVVARRPQVNPRPQRFARANAMARA
jgi:hypothetical protein